jgi:hypothetical protein
MSARQHIALAGGDAEQPGGQEASKRTCTTATCAAMLTLTSVSLKLL